jgi:hypothetical protein
MLHDRLMCCIKLSGETLKFATMTGYLCEVGLFRFCLCGASIGVEVAVYFSRRNQLSFFLWATEADIIHKFSHYVADMYTKMDICAKF